MNWDRIEGNRQVRWRFLILAAVAGFVGRGGFAASPATIIRLLLALFVAVFVVTLAFSVLSEPGMTESAPDSGGGIRQALPDPQLREP